MADDRGRLVRGTWSSGVVREYAYNDKDKLVGVREPGRILRNWFDESGRWVRQEVKASEDDNDPYIATARYVAENGSVVESGFDEGDGLVITRYNKHHYIVSETWDADGSAPIVFTYNLDAVSNEPNGTTLSCFGATGPITRAVPLKSARDEATKADLARDNCVRHPRIGPVAR